MTKKHICEICQKEFTRSNTLLRHNRTVKCKKKEKREKRENKEIEGKGSNKLDVKDLKLLKQENQIRTLKSEIRGYKKVLDNVAPKNQTININNGTINNTTNNTINNNVLNNILLERQTPLDISKETVREKTKKIHVYSLSSPKKVAKIINKEILTDQDGKPVVYNTNRTKPNVVYHLPGKGQIISISCEDLINMIGGTFREVIYDKIREENESDHKIICGDEKYDEQIDKFIAKQESQMDIMIILKSYDGVHEALADYAYNNMSNDRRLLKKEIEDAGKKGKIDRGKEQKDEVEKVMIIFIDP